MIMILEDLLNSWLDKYMERRRERRLIRQQKKLEYNQICSSIIDKISKNFDWRKLKKEHGDFKYSKYIELVYCNDGRGGDWYELYVDEQEIKCDYELISKLLNFFSIKYRETVKERILTRVNELVTT